MRVVSGHALIEKSINLAVSNSPKKDIVMKPTANLLVFLLIKQTNVWICAAEQVLLSIVSKFCFRQSLAC